MTQPTNDGRTGPLPPAGLQHADADRALREDNDSRDSDAGVADGDQGGDRDLLGREDDRLDGRTSAERDEAERYDQDRDTSPRVDHGDSDRGVDREATIDPDYTVEDDPNVISLAEQEGDRNDGSSASRQRQAEERLAEGFDADRGHNGDRGPDLDSDRNLRDDDGLLDRDRDHRGDGQLDGRDSRGGAHRADVPTREGNPGPADDVPMTDDVPSNGDRRGDGRR